MLLRALFLALALGLGWTWGHAAALGCERGVVGEQALFQLQNFFPDTQKGDFVIARHCWKVEGY